MPRRKRSPHPGVVIRPARPEQYQRAQIRFTDPDSGKQRYETIPDGADPKAYAKRRSLELMNRRDELERGAPKLSNTDLSELVDAYFREAVIRDSTATMYGYSTALLLRWGGVRSGDELTLAKLRELRAWLTKLPKRGAHTVNRDLRTIAAVLEHSRKAGRCPRLSSENISDGLERIKAATVRKDYNRDCRGVLQHALLRDVDFAAYVAVLMLTGMRAGEALAITTGSLELAAKRLRLESHETKTARWRDVELSWTPAGAQIIEALGHGKPPGWKLFGAATLSTMREHRRAYTGPEFDFQELRRTASTYLCSMPDVGLWLAAKSLGHHPEVARKHYAGVVRTNAKTLEEALGIQKELDRLLDVLVDRRGASLGAPILVGR